MFFWLLKEDDNDKMREMIDDYTKTANMLWEHRARLIKEVEAERDPDRLRQLEERKNLLEIERYEILEDLRSMRSYMRARGDEPGDKN